MENNVILKKRVGEFMPSWSIHLAIARKLNQEFKIDKDVFYYGNILPDINNVYKDHYATHYYKKTTGNSLMKAKIDLDSFLKDYQSLLTNPLILGYYCHLLTDKFYNEYIYKQKCLYNLQGEILGFKKNNKIIKDKRLATHIRQSKHYDFNLYGKYLFEEDDLLFDYSKILESTYLLKDNFISAEILQDTLLYLETEFVTFNKLSFCQRIFKYHYKLFTQNELDNLFEKCFDYIITDLETRRVLRKTDLL